jgi:hypothetical protein
LNRDKHDHLIEVSTVETAPVTAAEGFAKCEVKYLFTLHIEMLVPLLRVVMLMRSPSIVVGRPVPYVIKKSEFLHGYPRGVLD